MKMHDLLKILSNNNKIRLLSKLKKCFWKHFLKYFAIQLFEDKKSISWGVPPQLSGFVCAYHPAAVGSSPKHTIYAFIIYSNCAIFVMWRERK